MRFGLEEALGGGSGGFPSGVPEAAFQRLCSVLQRSCEHGQLAPISGGWQTTRDLCYTSQLRVTIDQQGQRHTVHKQLLQRVDMAGYAPPPLQVQALIQT